MRRALLCLGILVLLGSTARGQSCALTVHLSSGQSVTIALADIRRIVFAGVSMGVEEPAGPDATATPFLLLQSYPNPSRPSATIEYEIPAEAEVRVRVMDLRGALVKELLHETQVAGRHRVIWDGTAGSRAPVPSGMYLYVVECDGQALARRLLLVK